MTRRTSRKRTSRSLRSNSSVMRYSSGSPVDERGGTYLSDQILGKRYLKLGREIVQRFLDSAGWEPQGSVGANHKSRREARIDAMAALMLDGLDDNRRGAAQERDRALSIAGDCLDEITESINP